MDTTEDKPNLLIADSEILVRHHLAEYLRECGYRIFEAGDRREAEAILAERSDQVGCVLADADLAGGGFALRAHVREHYPDIEVILSGNVEAAAKAAGMLCDAGPNLARPYDPQMVVDRIRRLRSTARR